MNPVLCQLRKLIARADDLIDIVYPPEPPEPPIPPTTLEAALLLLIPTAGLFKDVAGTIPATVAGDKIAAWKDMRTGGKMFTQATVALQPILAFVGGKPVVRFTGGQYLYLTNNFAGITVNSSAIFGYKVGAPSKDYYNVFDGPNATNNWTRYDNINGAYPGTFLGARQNAMFLVPFPGGKIIYSISRQEGSYNGRINGAQVASVAPPALNNTGSGWSIGTGSGVVANDYFNGDVFGIAIYSTPAGTSHADHVTGVTVIENYISTFYPDATLDWNPALGLFPSTIGPTPVFSRASAATMIDVTGKVVWGPENLVLQSVNMAAAPWGIPAGGSTIASATGGITSSDGSIPWKLMTLAVSAVHGIQQQISGGIGIYTTSFEVQYGNHAWIAVGFYDGGYQVCYFNISTGTVGVNSPGVTGSIANLGGGRFRVSATRTVLAGNPYAALFIAQSDGGSLTWIPLGTEFAYISLPQIERSPVARTYLPTTTAPVYGPRITYDPISHQCLGYLAEEQRTNYLLNSEALPTQSVAVTAQAYCLSFYGTGTIVLSGAFAGSLVGTGAFPTRSVLVFTPTAGSLLLTVTGTVEKAQLE